METSQCSRTSAYFVDVRLQGAVTAIQIIDGGTVVVNLILQVLVSSLTSSRFFLVSFIASRSFCNICICTSLLFCKVILIQLVCNSSNIVIDCLETIGYVLIYLLNNFILCGIGTLAFSSFLCNGLITGSSFCIDILLQRIICVYTGILFGKVIFVQLIGNRSDILIERIETIGYVLIYLLNNFILCGISALAFSSFLCNGLITGSSFCIDILLQRIICVYTGILFGKVIFVQLIGNRSDILIERIETIGYVLVDLFDNFILCFIGTNTVCDFLMQSSIYISEILTNRLFLLNQITFRRNSLVIRNQCNSIIQTFGNCIGIVSSLRSITGSLRSCFRSISRSQSVGIFQSILNIRNIFLTLSNIACVGMDFSICFIYPAIGIRKTFFQILCIVNDSLRVILNGCSQRFINLTLAS